MGKHDKKEEQKVKYNWEPPKDEWYKARITALKEENERLRAELNKKDEHITVFEKTVDFQDERYTDCCNEYRQILKEKDDEIAVLQGKINMLKEAVVNGALREVLA